MTTTVRVEAHCVNTKEVLVSVTGEPDRVLQNGETIDTFACDDRVISVREVRKDRHGN